MLGEIRFNVKCAGRTKVGQWWIKKHKSESGRALVGEDVMLESSDAPERVKCLGLMSRCT